MAWFAAQGLDFVSLPFFIGHVPMRDAVQPGFLIAPRAIDLAIGAALVALCFGLAGDRGPVWGLRLGAGLAAVAALASIARLLVSRAD